MEEEDEDEEEEEEEDEEEKKEKFQNIENGGKKIDEAARTFLFVVLCTACSTTSSLPGSC